MPSCGIMKLAISRNISTISTLSRFNRRFHRTTESTSVSTAAKVDDINSDVRPVWEIPGPKNYPVIGSTIDIYTDKDFNPLKIHKYWTKQFKKYGPISRIKLFGHPWMVAISEPDDFEKVFRATQDNPVRQGLYSLKNIRYESMDNYFEKKGGIFVENDEEWWRVRSQVQTPMMKPKNIVKYLPQMDQVALDFVDRISSLQKEFGEMPSNFQLELYKWALESVSLVTLNRRLGCLDSNLPHDSTQVKLINIVNTIFELLAQVEFKLPWWKVYKTAEYKELEAKHEAFFRIMDEYMIKAEEELKQMASDPMADDHEKTLLQILLEKDRLSRKDIMTFIIDLCFAGIDTTSHTIGFTLYLLAKNPKAQQKLQEEVDTVLGKENQAISESHLARLSYLKSCIKESQRLFPITIGTVRHLNKDLDLRGYKIPKGHQILIFNFAALKNENYFSRPKEYLPERWARDQPLGHIHPYAALPFSHGTRMCVGRRIAEQEMYLIIARIMQRFNVHYNYQDMDFTTRLVSVPSEPLRFEFHERK